MVRQQIAVYVTRTTRWPKYAGHSLRTARISFSKYSLGKLQIKGSTSKCIKQVSSKNDGKSLDGHRVVVVGLQAYNDIVTTHACVPRSDLADVENMHAIPMLTWQGRGRYLRPPRLPSVFQYRAWQKTRQHVRHGIRRSCPFAHKLPIRRRHN